jgi:transposase
VNTKHEQILSLLAEGLSVNEVANKVGVSKQYVYVTRWKDDRSKGNALRNSRGVTKAKAKAKTKKKSTRIARPQMLTKGIIDQLKEAERAIYNQIPALAAKLDEDKAKAKADADMVNSPDHYTAGGIETYDFIVAKGLSYELGNVVKYVSRADYKGNKLQDLLKAQWYLNAAIRMAGAGRVGVQNG